MTDAPSDDKIEDVSSSSTAATLVPSVSPGQDDGQFVDTPAQFWASVIGIVAFLVILCGATVLVYARWRAKRAQYSAVPNMEEMRMGDMRSRRVSARDGDDAEAGLLAHADGQREGVSSDRVGFSSGFLDDDDAEEGGTLSNDMTDQRYHQQDTCTHA